MKRMLLKTEAIRVIELLFGEDSEEAIDFIDSAAWLGKKEVNDLMWAILGRPDYFEEAEDDEYEDDWGYNEDMGFDPYMGCYSDDC